MFSWPEFGVFINGRTVKGFAKPGPVDFVYSAQAQLLLRKQQINNLYVHPRDMRHDIRLNIGLDLWSQLAL